MEQDDSVTYLALTQRSTVRTVFFEKVCIFKF